MPYSTVKSTNYLFTVKFAHQKKVYRKLEIYGEWSLYELAGLILKSVKFDLDHCFGFYSNLKRYGDSEEMYELFADMALEDGDNSELNENSKPTKTTTVAQVFEPKKKMLFIFDYGDFWEFEVTCTGISDKEATKTGVIKTEGKTPKQYPRTEKGQDEWELFH
jgi:hypothetical protein